MHGGGDAPHPPGGAGAGAPRGVPLPGSARRGRAACVQPAGAAWGASELRAALALTAKRAVRRRHIRARRRAGRRTP